MFSGHDFAEERLSPKQLQYINNRSAKYFGRPFLFTIFGYSAAVCSWHILFVGESPEWVKNLNSFSYIMCMVGIGIECVLSIIMFSLISSESSSIKVKWETCDMMSVTYKHSLYVYTRRLISGTSDFVFLMAAVLSGYAWTSFAFICFWCCVYFVREATRSEVSSWLRSLSDNSIEIVKAKNWDNATPVAQETGPWDS